MIRRNEIVIALVVGLLFSILVAIPVIRFLDWCDRSKIFETRPLVIYFKEIE